MVSAVLGILFAVTKTAMAIFLRYVFYRISMEHIYNIMDDTPTFADRLSQKEKEDYLNLLKKSCCKVFHSPTGSMARYAAICDLLRWPGLYNIIPISNLLDVVAESNQIACSAIDNMPIPSSVIETTPLTMMANKLSVAVGELIFEINKGKYGAYVQKNVKHIFFIPNIKDPNSNLTVSATNEPLTKTVFINTSVHDGDRSYERDAGSMSFDLIFQAGFLDAYHNHSEDFSRGVMSIENSDELPMKLKGYLDKVCSAIVSPFNMQYMDFETIPRKRQKMIIALLQRAQKSYSDRNARIRSNQFYKVLLKMMKVQKNLPYCDFLKGSIAENSDIIAAHNQFMGLSTGDYRIYQSIESIAEAEKSEPDCCSISFFNKNVIC